MENNTKEKHLDVFKDRYELHQENGTSVYYQGLQSKTTQQRYRKINQKLKDGYLSTVIKSIAQKDFSALSEKNQKLLKNMVDGITSEVGRALVGLACLQLTIKAIAPEQSIRLHKGSTKRDKFSWVDGISMRTLDRNYNTPFLRKYGLLNVNKDGVFMTRSLAENYPYSVLYKAEMRGPFSQWIAIVDAIENQTLPAELGLCYLISLLKNRSEIFKQKAEKACLLTDKFKEKSFDKIKDLISTFFNKTDYSARAFEVAMHSLYQAMSELDMLGDVDVVPMSQMRSANKKHGNVGDIELTEDGVIVESWDAKYGKPYLRDELEELHDKLLIHPEVKVAGFVCNESIDIRKDILSRREELKLETGVKIYLFSFDEWIDFECKKLNEKQKNCLAHKWLVAMVESFAQKRPDIAPIDEPCDAWIEDLIKIMECGDDRCN